MAKKSTLQKKKSTAVKNDEPKEVTVSKSRFGFLKRESTPKPPLENTILFSQRVWSTIRENKGLLGKLLLLYVVLSMFVIGVTQQDQYSGISESLKSYGQELGYGGTGSISQNLYLFTNTIAGGLNASFTSSQQIYVIGVILFIWLVVVWLLRYRMAGTDVNLRDGLYNASTPLIGTSLLLILGLVQLLPASLGFIGFSTVLSNGALNNPAELVIFSIISLALISLSLYWLTITLFALVVVTVPGTYPWAAYKTARTIIVGQRPRLLFRLLWLGLQLAITWVVVLFLMVVISSWISQSWIPIVPLTVQILAGWSLIYGASYIYLLYRRMIDEPVAS